MEKKSSIMQLQQFAKLSQKAIWRTGNQIVSYTRVSDPSQFDNTSLESQKKEAEKQAKRKGFTIKKYFGGTAESAKTDERKEFKKMLEYVKRDKTIVAILVYSYERFSRSKNAGYLTRELAKIGVQVLSVFQDVDVTTASGQLQQDIFYAFGNYDNVLRRDKTTRGMIENLRNGFWVASCPFGYTNLNRKEKAKYHKYIINKDGELFLKANDAVTGNPHKGIAKKFKNKDIPLKSFAKDEFSNTPFTGYLKKGHYYYKTRGKGAAVNERADLLNGLFMKELNKFRIEDKYKTEIAENVSTSLREKLKEKIEGSAAKKRRVTELEKDIESLELRYIKNEIDGELYQKYRVIFQQEKEEIEKEMAKSLFDSSNLESVVKKVIDISCNPLQVWISSDYDDKQRLQYLIFPEGILYNKKERVVRTPRINSVFSCIIDAARISTKNKNGCISECSHNSHLVVPTRLRDQKFGWQK